MAPSGSSASLQMGGCCGESDRDDSHLDGRTYGTVGAGAHLGTLEVGKLADIVLLDANPLADIKNTQTAAPSFAFLDADGETRVIIGVSWNEVPQIQLTAADGTARVALVVRPEGMGMVVLTDDQQRAKMIAPTDA